MTDAASLRAARWILAIGGIFMALATISGALGAHLLPGRLSTKELDIYETAAPSTPRSTRTRARGPART